MISPSFSRTVLYLDVILPGREAGNIEDLTDLLAEDWAKLGSVREMGVDTARWFRKEMENLWGSKHLAVFDEVEARNWVLEVSPFFLEPF